MKVKVWAVAGAGVVVSLALAIWWFAIDARAPESANGVFDIATYRALVSGDAGNLPTEVQLEIVGADTAPLFAAEAGGGFGIFHTAYTSFRVVSPSGDTVIDGAVDRDMAETISRSGHPQFSEAAYERVLAAMEAASLVLLTHEHRDHVIAVARNPNPVALAPRLMLTRPQIDALAMYAPPEGLSRALQTMRPMTLEGPRRVAPGIVVAPASGHSPGSTVIYVHTAAGKEYLFVGDIVWRMSNLTRLKTRPRFLQWIMFDPNEERHVVLRQVRALHDLQDAEPTLVIVPCHDQDYLEALVQHGELTRRFIAGLPRE